MTKQQIATTIRRAKDLMRTPTHHRAMTVHRIIGRIVAMRLPVDGTISEAHVVLNKSHRQLHPR
jgi:hypothetical protein